jgi:hypothetical protein
MKRIRTRRHDMSWHEQRMLDPDYARERNKQKARSSERMRRHDLAAEVFDQPRCRHGYVGGTCSVCEWVKRR